MYNVIFNATAERDVEMLRLHSPQAFKKLARLVEELREHPRSGTGQVEQLRHYAEETWSRRLSREHRLVYRIYESTVEVLVISAYGHYDNK